MVFLYVYLHMGPSNNITNHKSLSSEALIKIEVMLNYKVYVYVYALYIHIYVSVCNDYGMLST
jgi:hypothetical protein